MAARTKAWACKLDVTAVIFWVGVFKNFSKFGSLANRGVGPRLTSPARTIDKARSPIQRKVGRGVGTVKGVVCDGVLGKRQSCKKGDSLS